MKHIINPGEGLVKPFENDLISINYKIYLNNKLFISEKEFTQLLTQNNFTEGEIIILKSMKKFELCKIDIQYNYFIEEFINKSKLFNQNEFQNFITNSIQVSKVHSNINGSIILNNKENIDFENDLKIKNKEFIEFKDNFVNENRIRITYEVELLRLKNKITINSYKNIAYEKNTLCKGIGNICPWDTSLIKFIMQLKINNKVVYCDNYKELKIGQSEFSNKIKDIKKIIKSKNNYIKNLQFIIDDLINENLLMNSEIYDPLLRNLPCLIFESLKFMRILQIDILKFTLDKNKASNEFIKFKNIELDFNLMEDFSNKDLEFEVTLCLLNFQENFSIFNKNLILWDEETKLKKLQEYKKEANFYFIKQRLKKSKKINKYLINEYVKSINVDKTRNSDLLVRNKIDFIKPNIKFNFLENIEEEIKDPKIYYSTDYKFYFEMKKIFSNLILIYFKLEKVIKCMEYIELFYHIFSHESNLNLHKNKNSEQLIFDEIYEKVLYIEFKQKFKLCEFSECETLIKQLISYYHENKNLENPNLFELESNFNLEDKNLLRNRFINYQNEYNILKEKMNKSENEKNNMFRKMCRF